ncbi:MAG: group I truncated hemoglobin [Oligoflexus sp.]
MASLFENLGGQEAVDAVVETFYRKVLVDDRVSHFFDDVDMDQQLVKQRAFLTMAFGGPNSYTGADMRRAHLPLLEKGLNDSHVDAVVELLQASLRDHGVNDELIQNVTNIAESVRADVLNRTE